ncbi:MerR family transcriptional regulator [Promicromonospora sp. NPDC023987]|uniref:helix-turn-helix domain-containing protein n=1 Tax=Promicromonospora sp. NPDC023987 TaxID=3155360 RepID=UPI0033C643EA
MPWSTREVAELAGTTVNTLRHYHRIGLLEEPERRYNGYKQYEVQHLVSLLRIRRLVDLGVPLSQISDVIVCTEGTPDTLRELDRTLRETIERLGQARADIAGILRDSLPAVVTADLDSPAARSSESERSTVHVHTQPYGALALAEIQKLAESGTDGLGAALDRLAPDADEVDRRRLVTRLATKLAQHLVDRPWPEAPATHLSNSYHSTSRTTAEAARAPCNPAQLDVLHRAHNVARDLVRATREANRIVNAR